ncbi:hypothetical protein FJ955_03080 [Mesorhizobium sp. B2-2-2]|uniref:glycoside hydrolase family 73 protein n=1 Tax=Mesorhizobium sp. B2-2-2 TaxID=2589964 RepID=UPI00112B9DC4|nr:glycoside hydrolase family 73 protein [Mesorhizobium sp. B2-2-2]TPM33738.1 hypothetical protein FJ955_03080 [Mesorhizobium sp. B2-2-2]
MALSFIFGPDQQYKSPEELAKARSVANALLVQQSVPKNVGEGLSAIGQALLYRSLMGKANASEAAGKAGAAELFNPILAALGPQKFPDAPGSKVAAALTAKPKADNPNLPSSMDFANAETGGDKQAFIQSMMPAALDASEKTGVDPRIIVAQAAQETGWGKHAPGNNYFGIKSHGQGGGQNLATTEYVGGKPVRVNDSFRGYASPADSVAGYADFLLKNPRYKPMMQAQGMDAQLEALGASGYATDPNYAQSVGAIARGLPMPSAAAANDAMATGQPIPAQVASLDPSIGMPTQNGGRPIPPEYASKGIITQAQWDAMNRPGEDLAATTGRPVAGQPPQQASRPQPGAVGGPAAVTPEGQRVLAQMMQRQPMGGVPMPMQGMPLAGSPAPQGAPMPLPQAPQPAPQQQMAQAAPQVQQPGPDLSQVPVMAGGLGGQYQPGQGGPSLQQLYAALQEPWMNDQQRAVINAEIERQQQLNDPLRQLQIAKARKDVETPQKQWQKLDDNTLFDPASGETRSVAPTGPGAGKFRFKGNSVEAQGLNGLMDAGKITEDQAQQLAAGKTITDPTTGAIIFMTPQGVFGQSPQGGQPQPVLPSPQVQPPAQPQGAPVAPQAPNAVPQQAPAVAPPATAPGTPQRQGMIPLTDGKPTKPPTEAQARNQQLYQVAAPELKIVEDNFSALSNLPDQAWNAIPGGDNYGANYMQTPEFQRANNSLRTIIATYLYSTSGATANPGEVANQASILMPKPGEAPASVKDKLARVRTMVDAIRTATGGGQAGAAPLAPNAPRTTSSGLKYTVEP